MILHYKPNLNKLKLVFASTISISNSGGSLGIYKLIPSDGSNTVNLTPGNIIYTNNTYGAFLVQTANTPDDKVVNIAPTGTFDAMILELEDRNTKFELGRPGATLNNFYRVSIDGHGTQDAANLQGGDIVGDSYAVLDKPISGDFMDLLSSYPTDGGAVLIQTQLKRRFYGFTGTILID
ncbi:hypothetical protein MOUN0_H06260 [Monosporozyma unispora]